jgi:hypothetical protein
LGDTLRLIIDADPIVYLAGFAGELHEYELVLEDEKGNLSQDFFSPMPDVDLRVYKKQLSERGLTVVDQELRVTPEPLDHALNIVRSMVSHIRRAVKGDDRWQPQTIILLSGPGNFREEIATIKPYKGNRKEDYKPYWYQQIRNYLTNRMFARVVEGREADDEASILMRQAALEGVPAVLATIDKDLDQVPGLHYDYKKHVFYDVSEDDARDAFYAQILSGDATDNIPGLHRIGPAKAAQMIAQWVHDFDGKPEYLEEYLWEQVVTAYETIGIKDYDGPLSPAEQALEVARLVKMQEYAGHIWVPPGTFEEGEIL